MKITVTEYLHRNDDYYADWEREQAERGNYDQYGDAANKLHYRLYEVAVTMEVDLETGDYTILEVKDGDQSLTGMPTG